MNEIRIDFDVCNGCKTCYKACFVDVFRWNDEQKKPVVAYAEDCVGCNMCEINCPEDCLEVVIDWDAYFPPLIERDFPYHV
jgi:NAD-dependent dihydropyrimidine dehydrogenase PreA subunit